ncbi:MAG: tyrosine-type recombinase/integrase [Saprospiraceae bacterium]|nr:tyrosine-type recombinase/integrase [Saprospiraceae bacterium]
MIQIRDGARVEFRAAKTNDVISFKLPGLALEIINRYQGGEYVFPLLKGRGRLLNEISAKNAYANKVLKMLAKKAEIPKKISMHTARHTWATISLSNDITTKVVGKILGHKDLKTTQIYTNILDKRKDAAIDKWDDILGCAHPYSLP